MKLRIFQHGDHEQIAVIFTRAIHEIASAYYTPEQCHAWCDPQPNLARWLKRCELKRPFVMAADDGRISGFLELDTDGHIDCAYVNPDFARQGVMTRLTEHAVAAAFDMNLERVYVEASLCARPLFEKLGFGVISENLVTIRGVELLNYKMEIRRPQ